MSFTSTMKEKYPPGLLALCTMQATSMVGFMFIFSMATLYMTKMLSYTDKQAVTLFAAFGAIVYGAPLFGGFLGDKFLGHKFSVFISTICCGIGLLLIAIPNKFFFLIGLACFTVSTCVQVPNMYCLVGNLYDKHDERGHGGFTLAYVTMNLGAFLASGCSGFLSERIGFSATYVVGAVVTFATLIAYFTGHKYFHEGFRTDNVNLDMHSKKDRIKGIALYLLAVPICALGFNYPDTCNNLILLIGALAVIYILFLGLKYDSLQRKKLYVFLALTTVSIGWGILYMMAPTVLTLFVERNLDHHFLGFTIPTSSVIALDSLFIIICGPLLSWLWLYLSHKKHNPSGALKLSFGVILMGIGFIILVPGILSANSLGSTAFYWVIISYFFQAMGELFVNPVGFSLVGSLSPPGRNGFLMGFFQLGSGIASVLMGYLASEANQLEGIKAPLQTNNMYLHAFWHYGLYSIILGMIALIFVPYFSKIIRSTGSNL